MDNKRPAIVVVPGLWHPSSVYSKYQSELQDLGFPTFCDSHPSLYDKNASHSDDIEFLKSRLLTLLDLGYDVIVTAHSYGSGVAMAAITDLSKPHRKSNGVLGAIIVGPTIGKEEESPMDASSAAIDPGDPPDNFILPETPGPGLWDISDAMPMFSGAHPHLYDALSRSILPQGTKAVFTTYPRARAWSQPEFKGRLVCVIPKDDRAARPVQQRNMLARTGAEWKVIEMEGSHGLMMTKPHEMAALTMELCSEFTAKG